MFQRIPTGVYTVVVALAGVMAVCIPGLALYIDKYEGSSERYVTNSCLFDYKYPSESLQDIVTHVDQLSVINAISERTIEVDSGSEVTGSRVVHIALIEVENTLWRREGGPEAPAQFEIVIPGEPSAERRLVSGDTFAEVGNRYLAPLVRAESSGHASNDGYAWFPLTGCVLFQLDGDRIAQPEFGSYRQPAELADRLVGMSVEEFAGYVMAAATAEQQTGE
jgi:hypothetical protein